MQYVTRKSIKTLWNKATPTMLAKPWKKHTLFWKLTKTLILKGKIMTDDKNMWLEILDLGLIIVAQFSRESSSSPCPCIHPSASSCIPLRSPGTDPVCLLWTHRAPWEVCWSMTIRACWFFWASPGISKIVINNYCTVNLFTLIWRPRKRESSRAMAVWTESLSVNST